MLADRSDNNQVLDKGRKKFLNEIIIFVSVVDKKITILMPMVLRFVLNVTSYFINITVVVIIPKNNIKNFSFCNITDN